MPVWSRSRSWRITAVAVATAAAALTSSVVSSAPPASAGSGPKPGVAGAAITLGRHMALSAGFADIATGADGTAYVGWIAGPTGGGSRKVYLCVLPPGAKACQNGVQHIDSLGSSSASGLRVLIVKGTPTLLWFHDTTASETSSHGSEIAEATVSSGVLGAASDVATAPSFGSLLDATVAPNGAVWVITYPSAEKNRIEVREGLTSTPIVVKTPWFVGFAHVAWDHGKTILAVTKGGSAITTPPAYSATSGHTFGKFHTLAKTWAVGTDFDLAYASGHVRLLTGIGNADYWPVVSKWTGKGFSPRTLIGDKNSSHPSTHDVSVDKSGRFVDVANENDRITVSNLVNGTRAAIFRFPAHGLVAGAVPQISTTPRGRGWVMWGVEDGTAGEKLSVVPIRLADLHHSATKHSAHGSVTVIGPASCLPPDTISVGVKGHPAHGWSVSKATLTLNHKAVHGSINGATLTAGKSYLLKGAVVFRSGGHHSAAAATVRFRSCPNP